MDADREESIRLAIEMVNSGSSLYAAGKKYKVPPATVQRRMNGALSAKEFNESKRLLNPIQECLLEQYVMNLAQYKTVPTGAYVIGVAAKMLRVQDPEAPTPSRKWLTGFLKRCKYLKMTRKKYIQAPRIREDGLGLIELFFDRLSYLEERFQVTLDKIWNCDESCFHVGEKSKAVFAITPVGHNTTVTGPNSEPISALETINALGGIINPLLIYKGKSIMKNWFPEGNKEPALISATDTSFINKETFIKWFKEHFPFCDQWQILIMDGHSSHTDEDFMRFALSMKVIPLYLPSHMSNVLQPSDRACFGVAKQHYRPDVGTLYVDGLTSTKRFFFETYMKIRKTAYTPKIVLNGWARAGIFPHDITVAKNSFKAQMNMGPVIDVNPDTPTPLPTPILTPELLSRANLSSPCPEVPWKFNWRADRMKLMNSTNTEVLRYTRQLWSRFAEKCTQISLLQQENSRLKNQLDAGKVKKSTRPKHPKHNLNKKVMDFLGGDTFEEGGSGEGSGMQSTEGNGNVED